ncbi:MAG: glutathione S-transferase N-terminal domain-containing protein, partial [Halioglobus sp.]
MAADYILYGGDHSYYTGKVRAYMRFKGLDWEEVTASRAVYKSTILPQIGAAIVPVLATANGQFVQDTTDIIDFLEAAHPAVSVYPDTPVQKLVALMLELYGDEWLLIPAMHYRWSVLEQQRDFIFGEFGRMSAPDASLEEQLAIGERTSAMFRGSI